MANEFKRRINTGSIAGSTIMDVPIGSTIVIIGLSAANVGDVLTTLSLKFNSSFYMKDIQLPTGSTVSLLDGKLVLVAEDLLTEICASDGDIDFIVSYMEITSD